MQCKKYISCRHYRHEHINKVEDFLISNGYEYTIRHLKSPINGHLEWSVSVKNMTIDDLNAYTKLQESLDVWNMASFLFARNPHAPLWKLYIGGIRYEKIRSNLGSISGQHYRDCIMATVFHDNVYSLCFYSTNKKRRWVDYNSMVTSNARRHRRKYQDTRRFFENR